jgi:hypothetical protein
MATALAAGDQPRELPKVNSIENGMKKFTGALNQSQ